MSKQMRNAVIITVLVLVALLAALWATYTVYPRHFPWRPPSYPQTVPWDIEFFYTAKVVISTLNIALLVILVATYAFIYAKTRSEFTVGLIVFAAVLLLKDLAASPLVIWAFGYRLFGLGPFAFLPDLLEFAALSMLLYLSVKY
jgi:hypothetical protein